MNPSSEKLGAFLRDPRWVACLWGLFSLVVAAAKFRTPPTVGNVFYIYQQAGLRWVSGIPLYDRLDFVYFPTAAALFIPWAYLPFDWGGVLWRILNVAVFGVGVWRLAGHLRPDPEKLPALIIALVSAILSWSAARHGQMTLAMAGLMMVGCVSLERRDWWIAAACITGAVALKPLAIVLWLTCVVVYPRVLLPSLGAAAVYFGGTLLLPDSAYALGQYAAVPDMLQRCMVRDRAIYLHLFGMLQVLGVETPHMIRLAVSGVVALLVLALAFLIHRKGKTLPEAFHLYAVCSAYILLLGSGTEANTYAMMAPVLAMILAQAWNAREAKVQVLMVVLIVVSLLSSHIEKAFPGTIMMMIKPIIAVVLIGFILARAIPVLRAKADGPAPEAASADPT